MRGQQPQHRKAKTFFVLDGKVHPQEIADVEGSFDFTLTIVTSKADIAAWERYQIINDLPRELPEPDRY